jgi:hypothetical protein
MMGTRCGDVDFGAMAWIAQQTGQSFEDLERVVNKESGLLGSPASPPICALEKAWHAGNERAQLAIQTFVHRIARHIAGHAASLHRLDGVVFTGGIGENSTLVRALVAEHLKVFGIRLDDAKNALPGSAGERVISTDSSRVSARLSLPTKKKNDRAGRPPSWEGYPGCGLRLIKRESHESNNRYGRRALQRRMGGFRGEEWKNAVNVRDFIQHNYTPYEGDEAFLAQATPATTALWQKVMVGIRQENATHAPVDFDTNIATTITAHGPGYIDQDLETIVGLQTDKPLKRALHPYGGINMIRSSFEAYGREMDPQFEYLFTDLRKTHNQGVFDVYSPEMMRCRKSGVLTGLPDGYGRGRIIGDYRRVALYGIRYLVRERELQFADLQPKLERGEDLEATIRLREELAEHKARCCRSSRWRRTMALIFLVRR